MMLRALTGLLIVVTTATVVQGDDEAYLSKIVRLTEEERLQRAVCLDGSAPAYYWRSGWGSGANKFLIHYEGALLSVGGFLPLPGGGWCRSYEDCRNRSMGYLGSTKLHPETIDLTRMWGCYLSNDSVSNPLLHNWNVVLFKYCDGSSFSSSLKDPIDVNGTTLYFRGKQINEALLQELVKNRGLREASDVVVSGCSAGGLAVYSHVDGIARLLEGTGAKVRGLADSGFFLNWNVNNGTHWESLRWVVDTLNASAGLHQECINYYTDGRTNRTGVYHCFFAQYLMPHLRTPVFTIMSKFDAAQGLADKMYMYKAQRFNDAGDMMEAIFLRSFRDTHVRHGWLLDSCRHHCFYMGPHDDTLFEPWNTIRGPSGRSQREMFEAWYLENDFRTREESLFPHPCDKCCHPSET